MCKSSVPNQPTPIKTIPSRRFSCSATVSCGSSSRMNRAPPDSLRIWPGSLDNRWPRSSMTAAPQHWCVRSFIGGPTLLENKKVVIWEFVERDIRFGTEGWQIVPLPGMETNQLQTASRRTTNLVLPLRPCGPTATLCVSLASLSLFLFERPLDTVALEEPLTQSVKPVASASLPTPQTRLRLSWGHQSALVAGRFISHSRPATLW